MKRDDTPIAGAGDAGRADGTPTQTALDDHHIGIEARALADDHLTLKLWLRLLACTTQLETEVRRRLRARFGITLARFDYLAQLDRMPDGLRMNALSRYLMVTNGSITGLTDEMEKEGLVAREAVPDDRRSFLVRLTPQGQALFKRMATEHEAWVIELCADLPLPQRKTLFELLGTLRLSISNQQAKTAPSTRKQAKESAS